jgi:hypothetical protein
MSHQGLHIAIRVVRYEVVAILEPLWRPSLLDVALAVV